MKKVIDDSIKFAWAYLLMHGKLTSGKWSYYGGNWENELHPKAKQNPNRRDISWQEMHDWDIKRQELMSGLKDKVINIGIDWGKTDIPSVSDEDVFAGTYEPGDRCLGTLGKLVLLNGESYLIGSSDDDAAHLAETARQITRGRGESEVEKLALKL